TLYKLGIPLPNKRIRSAANEVLAASTPYNQDPLVVGENWPTRWLNRYPEFIKRKEKSIELERQKAMNFETVQDFFNKFEAAVREHTLQPDDIWNMDETGIRVGVGRGKWVIVPQDQAKGAFANIIG